MVNVSRTIDIKPHEYLSDSGLTFDELQGDMVIWADTGIGKTRYFMDYAKANPDVNLLFIVPLRALYQDIKAKAPDNFNVKVYDSALHSDFEALMMSESMKDYVLVIDEAHFLINTSDYRYETMMGIWRKSKNFKARILLSGTAEGLDAFGRVIRINSNREKRSLRIKHVKPFDVHNKQSKAAAIEMIQNYMEHQFKVASGEYPMSKRTILVLRINQKTIIRDIYQYIIETYGRQWFEAFNEDIIVRMSYTDDDNPLYAQPINVRNLDVLLTTSRLDAGVSFDYEDYDRMIMVGLIGTFNQQRINFQDCVQFVNRFRDNHNDPSQESRFIEAWLYCHYEDKEKLMYKDEDNEYEITYESAKSKIQFDSVDLLLSGIKNMLSFLNNVSQKDYIENLSKYLNVIIDNHTIDMRAIREVKDEPERVDYSTRIKHYGKFSSVATEVYADDPHFHLINSDDEVDQKRNTQYEEFSYRVDRFVTNLWELGVKIPLVNFFTQTKSGEYRLKTKTLKQCMSASYSPQLVRVITCDRFEFLNDYDATFSDCDEQGNVFQRIIGKYEAEITFKSVYLGYDTVQTNNNRRAIKKGNYNYIPKQQHNESISI